MFSKISRLSAIALTLLMPAPLLASGGSRTYYELNPLLPLALWWQWLLFVSVLGGLGFYVYHWYKKDSVELPRYLSIGLILLRATALLGLLVFFLNIEKKTEHKLVRNSKVLMLVDTSQSMGLTDTHDPDLRDQPSRIQQVIESFEKEEFFNELQNKHDVGIYRFDQEDQPRLLEYRLKTGSSSQDIDTQRRNYYYARKTELQTFLGVAFFLTVAMAGAFGYFYFSERKRLVGDLEEQNAWGFLAGILLLILIGIVLGVGFLRNSDISLEVALGAAELDIEAIEASKEIDLNENERDQIDDPTESILWEEELLADGRETRLGEALHFLLNKERGEPVAGVVVISDGRLNAGVPQRNAIQIAQEMNVPIHTIGMGSALQPINLKILDVEAPQRVFPDDKFLVTAYLQAHGLSGKSVKLSLASQTIGEKGELGSLVAEQTKTVVLDQDSQILQTRFEVTPKQTGKRQYQLVVQKLKEDTNFDDNTKEVIVSVVDRKTKVLLLAGGPMREFRFLRNQLFRDPAVVSDVLLQSATIGASQEANKVLETFPATEDELFQYDCIVAFDPDWLALSEAQIRLLDRWIAEKAGGLITIAGPVNTPLWSGMSTGKPKSRMLQVLYPVVFYRSGSAMLNLGRFKAESAWPLQFTRIGENAEYLWLHEESTRAKEIWEQFEGVFGYYAVKEPKPGAQVLAYFSDPETSMGRGKFPIYLASHYYGSGRVFFQASGEMWRIRTLDDSYFEKYYTKLIRWASEGRLLRDSTRGLLLVDKERCFLGESILLRAQLTNAQHSPWEGEEVSAIVLEPNGERREVTLKKEKGAAREGFYSASVPMLQEGDYEFQVLIPESPENEFLSRAVRVRLPEIEVEQPQRNDVLLRELADKTKGFNYQTLKQAFSLEAPTDTPLDMSGQNGVNDSSAPKGRPETADSQNSTMEVTQTNHKVSSAREKLDEGDANRTARQVDDPVVLPPLLFALKPQDHETYLPGIWDKLFDRKLMLTLLTVICMALCLEWTLRRLNKLA
ncbi:MAG: hypothetical protein MPJ24_00305 [Pirellulaceae bacterium]|nr:hypothetical protein [Pirellulaceae bacterium]